MQSRRGKPRNHLTEEQSQQLKTSFSSVPTQTRVVHDWASPEGIAFINLVHELIRGHVPLRWIAEDLDIDDRMLQQATCRTYSGRRSQ